MSGQRFFGDIEDAELPALPGELSPGEREMEDLVARGSSPEEMLKAARFPPRHHSDGTFTVTGFDVDQPKIDLTVDILVDTPGLRGAFAAAIAAHARSANVRSLVQANTGLSKFVDFLRDRGLTDIKPRHITDELLDGFRVWLDDFRQAEVGKPKPAAYAVFPRNGGEKLGKGRKIACMAQVLSVLRTVSVDAHRPFELRRDLDLVRAGDWQRPGVRQEAVNILTRSQLKALLRICRREVVETTGRLRAAWLIMDSDGAKGADDVRDPQLLLELKELHRRFGGKPPTASDLDLLERAAHPFPRLRGLKKREYRSALATLYPTARLLMPFVLLFAIYYRYNRSLVTTLKPSDLSEQPSPHGKRLVGQKFKNRAGKMQVASWPITTDLHNPATMRETLERWTSLVRDDAVAGEENHMFLERSTSWRTRSLDQTDAFDQGFRDFLKDHGDRIGARFTFRSLRPTVIDLVHHLFDGDLLATAEAGQHQVRTLMDHYLGDGARKRGEEALVPAGHKMNAWMRSDGLVDEREDRRRGDGSAATPGFECGDRYGCTVPGQRKDVYCTAYGMCGSCKQGHPQIQSPEAYALVWQLREALLRSRPRMPAESWIARWAPILDDLELTTLRKWPLRVRRLANLDIPQLPTVE